MNVEAKDITRMARSMAWERAKGELMSMLHTFHTPYDANDGQFDSLDYAIEKFVKNVEDNALYE